MVDYIAPAPWYLDLPASGNPRIKQKKQKATDKFNQFIAVVFNQNIIVQASGAESGTSGGYYLGRPWFRKSD